jgi:hypothetical protein
MPVLDFFSIFLNDLIFFSFNFYMVQKDVSFGLKVFFVIRCWQQHLKVLAISHAAIKYFEVILLTVLKLFLRGCCLQCLTFLAM